MSQIEQAIQEMEKVDLQRDDAIGILEKIISEKLRSLPIFMTDMITGDPLVRSRYLNEKEDFHHSVHDYSYNPFPEQVKIGRANYKGQQIFYGQLPDYSLIFTIKQQLAYSLLYYRFLRLACLYA